MTNERLAIISKVINDQYDDVSHDKQLVLKEMYKDVDLIEVLHNVDLVKANALPEDYHNVNIYSFLFIPDSQSTVKNFICFDVDHTEESYNNRVYINKILNIRTISHGKDVETEWGIDRQDLLALILKNDFNWSNLFGTQMHLIYDSGKASDSGYYYRDMEFKSVTLNSLQRGTSNNFSNLKTI